MKKLIVGSGICCGQYSKNSDISKAGIWYANGI